jgi:enamine deaminase RidA (YjgF/YER057c/UK114 family)
VLTILQVGALDDPAEQIVIEAVVDTHHVVNPNGLAFLFGQSGTSYKAALQRLRSSAESAGVTADRVVSSTCFTAQTESFSTAAAQMHSLFPKTAVNVVQAVRDPVDGSALCEAVAQLSVSPLQVVVNTGKNVVLVNTPQLVFTGLQLSFGSYLDDAHEAFARLQRTARSIQQSETPVEVDAFSLDRSAASALRRTNSLAPGVFSVQTVEGLSSIDATGGIEAILAVGGSDSSFLSSGGTAGKTDGGGAKAGEQ